MVLLFLWILLGAPPSPKVGCRGGYSPAAAVNPATTTTLVVFSSHLSGPHNHHLAYFNPPPTPIHVLTLSLTSNPVEPTWISPCNLSIFSVPSKVCKCLLCLFSLFCEPYLLILAQTCPISLFTPDFTIVGPTQAQLSSFAQMVNKSQLWKQ